jgi:hypothetical protein
MKKEYSSNIEQDLKGIKGILILLAIGVVISPFKLLPSYFEAINTSFKARTWSLIFNTDIDPIARAYNQVLAFELMGLMLLILAMFVQIYLFFSKHYLFPRVFIGILVSNTLFYCSINYLLLLIDPTNVQASKDMTQTLIQNSIPVCVWIPYMLKSKRVKATFVVNKPDFK